MARNTRFYSQKNHSVLIRTTATSYLLRDFAEGASIKWEPTTTEQVAVMAGFDGARISVASDPSGRITVTLKPTSPSCGYLVRLYQQQLSGTPVIFDVVITTGVNETHVLRNALISKASGGESGDKTMAPREFIFVGEELVDDDSQY